MSSRTLASVALGALFLAGFSGCTKNEPPTPDPSAVIPSTNVAVARPKLNVRSPMGPMARLDPQAVKDHRVDVCYYGTLSLRQARDSYLASLGKSEPSEKKIPSFGTPSAARPDAVGTAIAAAPKAPAPKPVASSAPAASSAAAATLPPAPGRLFDFALRAPHEQNARICTSAMTMKEPAMAGVDEALNVFSPFAVELAKDIALATGYYQSEEYKKDSFAKGKALHKKLLEEFAKLDEQEEAFAAALDTYRKAHPADPAKMDEGERAVAATYEDARQVVLILAVKKPDPALYKANVEKLDKSVAALKAFSAAHPEDSWSKMLTPPFDAFLQASKAAKVTDKGLAPEDFLNLVTSFTTLVNGRQRGLQRSMISKGQVIPLVQPPALAPQVNSAAPAPILAPQ
jgi:hypothetical protein